MSWMSVPWVGDEVVGVSLHEVRLHEVARLSRAGAAYDEHVVVRLGPLVVGGIDEADARPLGEDDVVVGVLPIRVRSISFAVAQRALPCSSPLR